MLKDALSVKGLKIQSPQGPHGTLSAKTVQSVTMMKNQLIQIQSMVTDISPGFDVYIKPKSLLTLVNEHLHGVIRMHDPTPNVLTCSRIFIRAVMETLKKTNRLWI